MSVKDDDEKSTSPNPAKMNIRPQAMNFPEALDEILAGAKVTKEDWEDEDIYGFMDNDQLMLHRNRKDHQWILSKGDIEGEDFFVIN